MTVEIISKHNGKTIKKIEEGLDYVLIFFTDGSKMKIRAVGAHNPELWLEID